MFTWIGWIFFVAITFAAAAVGSAFTASSVNTWYRELARPAGTPPAWVFGPVWTTLYLLMATAAWLVWRQRVVAAISLPLGLFFAQLALNAAWSYLFFGLRRPGLALIEIAVLLLAVVATSIAFAPISRLALWLMTPYIAWLIYATYLNLGFWWLNRAAA